MYQYTVNTIVLIRYIYIIIGGDYTSGPYSVIFPAGRTRAVLDISVINDNILEVNELFSLAVNSTTLPSNVTSVDQTTITITDNDSKLSYHSKLYVCACMCGTVSFVMH